MFYLKSLFFKIYSDSYDEMHDIEHGSMIMHPHIIKYVKKDISLNSRILDFGCGTGLLTSLVYQSNYKNILGFDSSPAMLNYAKSKYSAKIFSTTKSLPLSPPYYDVIICNSVLQYNKYYMNIIYDLYMLLNKKGIIFISLPHNKTTKEELLKASNYLKEKKFNAALVQVCITIGWLYRENKSFSYEEIVDNASKLNISNIVMLQTNSWGYLIKITKEDTN